VTSNRTNSQVAIFARNAHTAWKTLLQELLDNGQESKPRDQRTKELLGLQLRFTEGRQNLIADADRGLNYRFLVAQWLATVAGVEEKNLERYNKQLSKFEDDGRGGKYPSYGPRLLPQWPYVLKQLMDDRDTRQAVASIWEAQTMTGERWVPCTLSLQFMLRPRFQLLPQYDKKDERLFLHVIATMRSSDAFLGLPYDIFNFTQLANVIASALTLTLRQRIDVGEFVLNLGSSHLYERDWEKAKQVADRTDAGVHFIESPRLPPDLNHHLAGLQQLITQQPQPLESKDWSWWPWPWRQYVEAMEAQTSAEALKILRELERRNE